MSRRPCVENFPCGVARNDFIMGHYFWHFRFGDGKYSRMAMEGRVEGSV
jgi:hypothetical protein